MSTARVTAAEANELDLSLVRDDVPFHWMRRLRLIPAQGLGLARRALFFSLLTWAPIMVWSAYVGRASWAGSETVLQHFDVHVRCLISIPVMILAQGFTQRVMRACVPSLSVCVRSSPCWCRPRFPPSPSSRFGSPPARSSRDCCAS